MPRTGKVSVPVITSWDAAWIESAVVGRRSFEISEVLQIGQVIAAEATMALQLGQCRESGLSPSVRARSPLARICGASMGPRRTKFPAKSKTKQLSLPGKILVPRPQA